MNNLLQDFRFAIRLLLKQPSHTAVAVIVLALGIGATTVIFSVVNAMLLRPLPYKDSERIVLLSESAPSQGLEFKALSYPNFADWRDRSQVFDSIGAFRERGFVLTEVDDPERVEGASVSADTFKVLDVQPMLGRLFLPEEDQPGGNPVVILGYGLWQRRFGADRNILDQTVIVQGQKRTVVGVMPPDFKFPNVGEIWVPLALNAARESRDAHNLIALGRLKAGVSVEQARSEMQTIASALEQQYPANNAGSTALLMPYHEVLVRDMKQLLLILLAAVGAVLLIVCANTASLLLARAVGREKEIAVRLALGATRGRLIRQLLTESTLLALAGGLVGVGLAYLGVELIHALIAIPLPFWLRIGIDWQVLGFTLVVSILTGIIFGLAPALQASNPHLSETLKEGTKGSVSVGGRSRLGSLLVVVEMALCVILLIAAGLVIQSFLRLKNVDTGYDPTNVLTVYLGLSPAKYAQPVQRVNFFQEVVNRTSSLPGVVSCGAISNLPLGNIPWGKGITIEGRPAPDSEALPITHYRVVTLSYFQTMGITLLSGREFNEQDTGNAPGVVIISETMANQYWPDGDSIGKRIRFGRPSDNAPVVTVVGVVEDVKNDGLDSLVKPCVYIPHAQDPVGFMTLVARTASDPHSLINPVKQEVRALDKDLPLVNVKTMQQLVTENYWQKRFSTTMLSIFAAIALILASVGVYGVISYSVRRRKHEIGVRMALGAQPRDVLALVVKQGMVLAAVGVVIGLIGAGILSRLMSSLLFGVSATDPVIFIIAPGALVLVAFISTFIPAYGATKVDPMLALRAEK